ncbi:MAG TPA: M23 family metallopeptidase [Bryobacteraceae bacterium]|nr:M23 family metallopeptidase [Bryobacteraceae bacterium]
MLKNVLAAVVVIILIVFGFVWFSGKHAEIKLARPVAAIGASTTILIQANGPNGVKAFSASLEQDGQTKTIFEDKSRSRQKGVIYSFTAGKKEAPFLKEGPATLIAKAQSNDFRGATTTFVQDIQVVLKAPSIVADGRQHYINQGGSELVLLDLAGNWAEAGVRVANYSAGTFAIPGEPDNSNHRFSLFPFPWNVSSDAVPQAFAKNGAGTEVSTTFWVRVFPKRFRSSDIQLNDRELQKVDGELDPDGSGSLVERFVKINRETRRANAEQIYELRNNTEHRILWSGPFIPVKGARESYFADRRSYYYQGKKVDEQVHLGYDLAQTANMPVKAANSGKVIYADRLGIYGNCIIIDHGYSLQSLYGHLSKIGVQVGQMVQKEQQIGISGATGMAFGDHVHFSMLVDGIQIDPKEWWDEHWIHDRILSKIGVGAAGNAFSAGIGDPPMREEPVVHHRVRHHRR